MCRCRHVIVLLGVKCLSVDVGIYDTCPFLFCPVGVHVENVQCCSLYIFMYCVRALCKTKSSYYYYANVLVLNFCDAAYGLDYKLNFSGETVK